MRKIEVGAVALIVLASACRYQPSPVPLQGAPADIAALHGEWTGEYVSSESGRSGTLALTIVAGKDTAYGDVVMTPARRQSVIAADAGTREHMTHASAPEVLRVAFVRVAGGMVAGELEPYVAPDCRCVVQTIFQGVVKSNTINGEYFTSGEGGLRQQGRWSASRKLVAAK